MRDEAPVKVEQVEEESKKTTYEQYEQHLHAFFLKIFQFVIVDMWQCPSALIMLGMVAGGICGRHAAALSVGFIQCSLFDGKRHLIARCLIECGMALECALFNSPFRCIALHRVGDAVAHAFKLQLMTVYNGASLAIALMAFLSPSLRIFFCILCHSVIMMCAALVDSRKKYC